MGEHLQINKEDVQRLLDSAKILREVASQEDIERIKGKLANVRIQIGERRPPPSADVRHFTSLPHYKRAQSTPPR